MKVPPDFAKSAIAYLHMGLVGEKPPFLPTYPQG